MELTDLSNEQLLAAFALYQAHWERFSKLHNLSDQVRQAPVKGGTLGEAIGRNLAETEQRLQAVIQEMNTRGIHPPQ